MRFHRVALLALALAGFAPAHAATIYQNTTQDTLLTYFYSTGITQLGDSITLGGVDRLADSASIQVYNSGSAGTFDVTLRFFNTGSPVGSQIGSSYLRSGVAIGSQGILTVNFPNLNLVLPDNLVFAVALSGASQGTNIGLNAFDPPTIGSSDNGNLIADLGSGFTTGATAPGTGNLYFQVNAASVPEPASISLAGAGLILAALASRKRR